MYAVTTTPGFIIESRPSGEAGKLLAIFTRDLGLVWATAQGIRLEKSKLRYHTQLYSMASFSFVRGKEFWKLTNAAETNESNQQDNNQELIARLALLLRRLLHGEEPHPELFDHIESSYRYIQITENLTSEQLATLESLIVFRIMHLLGYVATHNALGQRAVAAPIDETLIAEMISHRMGLNTYINKALRESHL